jgi:hypothetical protein
MIPNKETRALARNLTTFDTWLERLQLAAVSRIQWNLPDTVDPLYVERELFFNGRVIFFVADGSLVALSGFGSSKPNLYGIPLVRTVNAKNGFTAQLTNENSVIMYNNTLKRPTSPLAIDYAIRLANLDRIIELNANAQKTPYIIKATKENELSIRNAYAAIDNNEEFIAITEDFQPDALEVLNTGANFSGLQLRTLQQAIMDEYLLQIGIASANTQKAERLITSEVAASNGGLMIYQEAFMAPRRNAAKFINDRFGDYLKEPVEPKFVSDVVNYILPGMNPAEGVLNNG